MEIVKQNEAYQIIKKRSGRYGVRGSDRKWITGDEKVKILVAEGLLKAPAPKPSEEEAVPEAPEQSNESEASADDENA